ncbi:hypothetical protein GGR57DRAFT_498349 [Xylariaceae sp. FL1272]|nr:hypothetical protein GGR57DRAFT_498349 [Xylariaceae sp. FL1272]
MSSQTEPPGADPPYECDPDWNFIVRVLDGDHTRLFLVDENAVWRCSAICVDDEYEYLPLYDVDATPVLEADPDGMQVVLDIIHGNFSRIPKSPSVDVLYGIAMVVFSYKAQHMLLPWAREWLKNLRCDDSHEYEEIETVKKFLIAWLFGSKNDVLYYVMKLVSHNNGTVRERTSGGWKDYTLPASMNQTILEMREDLLKKYLKIFEDQVDSLMNKSKCQCINELCNQQILGSLIQSLCAGKLWRKPQAAGNSWRIEARSTSGQTPQQVYRVLSRMKRLQSECMDTWFSCVERELNDAHRNVERTFTGDKLDVSMRRQGTKTGCYEETPQDEGAIEPHNVPGNNVSGRGEDADNEGAIRRNEGGVPTN